MRIGIRRLDDLLYPRSTGSWDNDLFRAAILPWLHGDARLLDLGAGDGAVEQMGFRGKVACVCGVDPDPRVLDNPLLDEATVGRAEQLPYPDDHFDLVVANNVLEHLDWPKPSFREVARVLKPGGVFLSKTPNRWHYVPLIASSTPHWLHQRINQWRGRRAVHTFPTRYRANTPRAVKRLARQAALKVRQIRLIEGRPEYLRMTAPTYLAGWLYERIVNRVPGLSRFRVVMICVLQKPTSAGVHHRTWGQAA